MRARSRTSILLSALGVVLLVPAVSGAQSDPLKCQRAVVKETTKFFAAKVKALQKCEESKAKDKLVASTDCQTEAAAKIVKAESKLRAGIDKQCGGANKVCDGVDDNLDYQTLFGMSTCPNFENGSCTQPIAADDCTGLRECLVCIGEAVVDQLVPFLYQDFDATAFGASTSPAKEINKCQLAIGKEATKFALAKHKTLGKCWDARYKGKHTAACPDAGANPTIAKDAVKAAEKIAKAESKKIVKLCKACGRSDKDCDDAVMPVNPGVPTLGASNPQGDIPLTDVFTIVPDCPALTAPARADRGPVDCAQKNPLTTLADLVFCVDCVAEFKVDCFDAARVTNTFGPFAQVAPECNSGTPAPTPTPTLTATPTPTVTPTPLPPGSHTDLTIEFGGETRLYDLTIPFLCSGGPCPLVLDFHGFTSNKTDQRFLSGFNDLASTSGFVVAFPLGLFGQVGDPEEPDPNDPLAGPSWNAGVCCGDAQATAVDDVGFARALVTAISNVTSIDADRVYATGLSNGGGLAHRLACEAADVFAAVAPLASPLLLDPLSTCTPSEPVPVIHFAGTTDPIVPYAGGTGMFPEDGEGCSATTVGIGTMPSATASLERWRDLNGCGAGAPDQIVAKGLGMCEIYDTSCPAGVEVQLCSIEGDNSAGNTFGCFFVPACYDGHVLYCTQDIANVAAEAWGFLSQFTLSP